MGFVSAKEVAKGLNIEKFGFLGTAFGAALMQLTKLSHFNKVYEDRKHLSGTQFIDSILNYLEVDFEIPEKVQVEEAFRKLLEDNPDLTKYLFNKFKKILDTST